MSAMSEVDAKFAALTEKVDRLEDEVYKWHILVDMLIDTQLRIVSILKGEKVEKEKPQ